MNLFFDSCGGVGDLIFNMVVVDEMKNLNPNSKIIFGIKNKALSGLVTKSVYRLRPFQGKESWFLG